LSTSSLSLARSARIGQRLEKQSAGARGGVEEISQNRIDVHAMEQRRR